MAIVNIINHRALTRLLTTVLVLVCLLSMPTLVRAEPPGPEERLASIEAILTGILKQLDIIDNHTNTRLDDFTANVNANREEISRSRDELGRKIDDNRRELTDQLNSQFRWLLTAVIGTPMSMAALLAYFWRRQQNSGG